MSFTEEGMNRDRYRDHNCYQVTSCDVAVSCIQHSCSTVMAHTQSIICIPVSELVFPVLFLQSLLCPLNFFIYFLHCYVTDMPATVYRALGWGLLRLAPIIAAGFSAAF